MAISALFIYVWAVLSLYLDLKGKGKEFHYNILFALSDMSTVLAFAYMTSFSHTGKCTMSTYHYYIVLDSILLACSTLVLTFTTSRHHYSETFAGIFRFLLMLAIFILLGIFLGYQMVTHFNDDFPEWNPPNIKTRNISTLVLPVSCFFDPDLIRSENPYAPKRYPVVLVGSQLDRIGQPVKNYQLPELWIYILLALLFVASSVMSFINCFPARRLNSQRAAKPARMDRPFYWPVVLGFCLATDIFCVWHISQLRIWANGSGSLKDNSETQLDSVGQLLPLFGLASILLVLLDNFKCRESRDKNQKKIQHGIKGFVRGLYTV